MPSLREAQERYARHYLAMAERAEPHLRSAHREAWLGRLELEHENLRAVLRWSQRGGERQAGLRLAGAVWRFWEVRGYLSEGRSWLEGLLVPVGTQDTSETAPAVRAKALNGAGNLAQEQGDYTRAAVLHGESLALFRELGDKGGISRSLGNLGNVAQRQGDLARATTLFEESLTLFRELGDKQSIAGLLNNLGIVAYAQGDYMRAAPLHEESLALFRELGDPRGIAISLGNLGNVAQQQGDYARATALFEESLTPFRELGYTRGIAGLLTNLGNLAYEQVDYTRAAVLHGESLALYQELGDTPGIAYCLEGLARVASAPGTAPGMLERAARLVGAAAALRSDIGAPLATSERATNERTVAALRAALGDAAFDTAWAAGQGMALEQALALALGKPATA